MYKPTLTYRIQFNKDFTFDSLAKHIPYLQSLGVDTLYASPIFRAAPLSMHGYDVLNPLMVNPEIGSEASLFALCKKLKKAGIGWVQDIVPNHMAFHPDNIWLADVLLKGRESTYAFLFDIDFSTRDGRLMVPFLAEPIEEAIAENKIQLIKLESSFYISYAGLNWPANLPAQLQKYNLKKINADPQLLLEAVNHQHYRLCFWQETDTRINYRRFFTVNSLICLNIQDKKAFELYHSYIFKLLKAGIFQGLRIDHVDGLADPRRYLQRLRSAVGKEPYLIVEKILAPGEDLPGDWEIQGSTGYDFLAMVNNLFTNSAAEKKFDQLYQKVIGKKLDYKRLSYEKKKAILSDHMRGEVDNLCNMLMTIASPEAQKVSRDQLSAAIAEMLAGMPVYKYYGTVFPLSDEESANLKVLISPLLRDTKFRTAAKLLSKVLLERPLQQDVAHNKKVARFYRRFMQFSGPVMAKGIEDTLMFSYNRFIAHTEVGDAPQAFGITAGEFHEHMLARQKQWPLSLNASATHDTKKGEDVRARLQALSGIPHQWETFVKALLHSISQVKPAFPVIAPLHKNDVYLIIQTLLGIVPFAATQEENLEERVAGFIQKALREAKKRSDWANPDESYESELIKFSQALLDKRQPFRKLIDDFLCEISKSVLVNSLAQVTLKFTCPGVPDIYQGSELWDLCLVDPDNRRAVDFKIRENLLKSSQTSSWDTLLKECASGAIKLRLIQVLASLRKSNASVFENGDYLPLQVNGQFKQHILAFARVQKDNFLVVTVPLGMAELCQKQACEPLALDWGDTEILLPNGAPLSWEDMLSGQKGHKAFGHKGIEICRLFTCLPLSVIKLKSPKSPRAAGILMHVSSLPSLYGIGDMGPQAMRFIDLLAANKQRYWQILPLNPVDRQNAYSPYSSCSALAANPWLISPESLVGEGLIEKNQLKTFQLPIQEQVDFLAVEDCKGRLIHQAYSHFKNHAPENLQSAYRYFRRTAHSWLVDFSLYMVLKKKYKNAPWYCWPAKYKNRDSNALAAIGEQKKNEMEVIEFAQFLFSRQWNALKTYANDKNISIIGDLSFYVSYDSVEVWKDPGLFQLDKNYNPILLAGVPPDYFNSSGQLWGMPVYNWDAMNKINYAWWIDRLKKNLAWYDLLRLDHFRAFESYWAVPKGQPDAKKGNWLAGPGIAFFKALKQQINHLPFIAEDLGEISQEVEVLRKQTGMPGMKVLQFAFNEDFPSSLHIPHNFDSSNYLIYSGTHDNNTAKGWFNHEADQVTRKNLKTYLGSPVNTFNINKKLISACYASIAHIAIIPFQDLLGLDQSARMNFPGSQEGNWRWKLKSLNLPTNTERWMILEMEKYGRF